MKICTKCGKKKDESEFYAIYNRQGIPTGSRNQCRACLAVINTRNVRRRHVASASSIVDQRLGGYVVQKDALPFSQDTCACYGMDPNVFHPKLDSGWKERLESSAQAIAICKGCPVRLECLRHAMNNNERLGVWGGISQQSRRNGRRDGLSPERLIELHG